MIPLFVDNLRSCSRCYVLLFSKKHATIPLYLWRYKGGQCDRHGRRVTYRRGGSEENPQKAVYCSEILEKRGHTCNQDGRWNMAGKGFRGRSLYQQADVQTRGQIKLVSVAHRMFNGLDPCLDIRRCNATLLLILPQGKEKRKGGRE